MERKYNARYDEYDNCMYPLPGESEESFMNRLNKLCESNPEPPAEVENLVSRLLAGEKLSEEELQKIVVRE